MDISINTIANSSNNSNKALRIGIVMSMIRRRRMTNAFASLSAPVVVLVSVLLAWSLSLGVHASPCSRCNLKASMNRFEGLQDLCCYSPLS